MPTVLVRGLAAFALAWLVTVLDRAPAAAQVFAGFDQFCDVPVIVVPNPQSASAARDAAGNPVIYVDPGVMANWTTSRMFALAHECGHHVLGHSLPQGMWFRNTQPWATAQQELQADCWAARQLAMIRDRVDLELMIRQFAGQGSLPQGPYPSGAARATAVAQCAGIHLRPPATACMTPQGVCPLGAHLSRDARCACSSPLGFIEGVAR